MIRAVSRARRTGQGGEEDQRERKPEDGSARGGSDWGGRQELAMYPGREHPSGPGYAGRPDCQRPVAHAG